MPKKFITRLATPENIEQLIDLRVLMQKEVNNLKGNDFVVDPKYIESIKNYFQEALRNGSYISIVAENNGILVGAVGLVIYEKPPSFTGRNGRYGLITNVYTRVDWRGQGVATELMKLIIETARNSHVDKLHLGTQPNAKKMYEGLGFRPARMTQLELDL